ncbi:GNAT family N-acetyltransferase [Nakamurella silvestris]|nr:GNAT family N-acetyltransferase [Nakamurella silvestris]
MVARRPLARHCSRTRCRPDGTGSAEFQVLGKHFLSVTISLENARRSPRTPSATTSTVNPTYQLRFANSRSEVEAAQRLRHEVFSAELGAVTTGRPGRDEDPFDDLCDHLIVWQITPGVLDPDADGTPDASTSTEQAVATYRLLPPNANDATPRSHGLYSSGEFNLEPLEHLMDSLVEAGRACVHPDHRNGATMALLWGGIARYMQLGGYRYLLGCGSVSLADGGAEAAAVWDVVRRNNMGPVRHWCSPRKPWHVPAVQAEPTAVPALMKGYLRLGATIVGAPCHDPGFNTADLLILLDLEDANERYLKFFLGAGA